MIGRRVWIVLLTLHFAAPCAVAQDIAFPLPKFGAPKTATPVLRPAILTHEVRISPNTAMPILPTNRPTLIDAAAASSDYIDPRYVQNSLHPDDKGLWQNLRDGWGDQAHRLVRDFSNFYLTDNLLCVGLAVGVAAPIANTHADIGIRDWYQRQAGQGTSQGADDTAAFFKLFGAHQYTVPGYIVLSAAGNLFPDDPWLGPMGDFGSRSLRALAVGAPTVGVLQVGLGAGRPFTGDSRWHPFRSSKAVSGHVFVGAIPFLTAASMIENRPLQALLFAGSLGTAWSRVHTDDHYFSQVLLGWTIAYLSVQAVNQTESQFGGRVHIVPVQFPTCTGLGVLINY
jgi:membrane-associated phospholipid phosphatase